MSIVRQRIFRWGVTALATIVAIPSPISAEEIENARTLTMQVMGRIVERCSIGQASAMHFGDLARPNLQLSTNIPLNCNFPFDVRVQSKFGGLAHEEQPKGEGPYAGTLPYSIGFQMAVRRPQTSLVSSTFQSLDLLSGRSFSSAGGIATDGMSVQVTLGRASSDAGLLAGRYREVIEITVSPI